MYVALAIDTYDTARGGAERGIRALARGLVSCGHHVVLVTARAVDPDPGWEVVQVPRPWFGRGRRIRGFAAAASRLLGNYGASVTFGDVPGGSIYLPHGGCWRAWRRQEIASAETPQEARAISRAIARSTRQKAARDLERSTLVHGRLAGIIALSRMVSDELRTIGCLKPMAVIPNGIALPAAPLAGPAPGGPRVLLFAAHNFRLKGLAPFVHLLAALKDTTGIVAGRDHPGPYRTLAKQLGCLNRLRFVGASASMETLFGECHALVQPTFYDPCSLTTLESLARGVPVVTTRFNGAGELVGEGGAVVEDPRDTAALAKATEAILTRNPRAEARRAAEAVADPAQTLKAVRQIEQWSR